MDAAGPVSKAGLEAPLSTRVRAVRTYEKGMAAGEQPPGFLLVPSPLVPPASGLQIP